MILSMRDFDVPAQPIKFAAFLNNKVRERFEQISTQISTSWLDPILAHPCTPPGAAEDRRGTVTMDAIVAAVVDHNHHPSNNGETILDVTLAAGTHAGAVYRAKVRKLETGCPLRIFF
jgi:hypothetical protein